MPSLAEAYDGASWDGRDPRRVATGGALFVLGAFAVVAAILVVSTPAGSLVGATADTAAKRLAGMLTGLGIPAMFLGVVVVLPASRRERVGVLAGASLTVVGVALFAHAYPVYWTQTSRSLAFPTAMVYFAGGAVSLWFVLSAVANYTLRNNPEGPVRLELTIEGENRTVSVSRANYRRYKQIIDGDGDTEQLVREIEAKYD
jgi:hypothetical protein